MKFQVWRSELKQYNGLVRKAAEELDRVEQARNKFLRDTIGFAPNDMASLEGTVDMIEKVFEMKEEK